MKNVMLRQFNNYQTENIRIKIIFIVVKLRCFHVVWFDLILNIVLRYKMFSLSIESVWKFFFKSFSIFFSLNLSKQKMRKRIVISNLKHMNFHSKAKMTRRINAKNRMNAKFLKNIIFEILNELLNTKNWMLKIWNWIWKIWTDIVFSGLKK